MNKQLIKILDDLDEWNEIYSEGTYILKVKDKEMNQIKDIIQTALT